MGSGASASGDASIAGKDTTIVEFGSEGQLVRHGSQKPWADVEQILLVIDPRTDPFHASKTPDDWTDAVKDKVVTFLLMPSLTSSPECLLCTEVGLQAFCAAGVPMKDVRIVRVDDYQSVGHKILAAMIEKDKKAYPAEEVDSMLKLVAPDEALGFKEVFKDYETGKEEVEKCEAVSRFHSNIYNFRAWCHWPVGNGVEEGDISEGVAKVIEILSGTDNALPSLEPVPSDFKTSKAFYGSKMSPVAVVFREDSEAKYKEIFKIPVVLCKDGKDFKDCADKYLILLLEPEDLCAEPEQKGYKTPGISFMGKFREENPDTTLVTVILDKDFDTMKSNSWLNLAIHHFVENCDAAIFATFSEAEQVANFFTKTRHPTEHVGRSLCMQCIPFPRLHFFTMGTAMGQELQDNEILVPAVTVGSKPTGLPLKKFNSQCPWSPFFLTGKDLKPLSPERLIAGADGFDGATVIQPAGLLKKLFKGIKHKFSVVEYNAMEEDGGMMDDYDAEESPPTNLWVTLFGEKYKEWEPLEIVEAECNCSDLMSEYDQYRGSAGPGDKVPL